MFPRYSVVTYMEKIKRVQKLWNGSYNYKRQVTSVETITDEYVENDQWTAEKIIENYM